MSVKTFDFLKIQNSKLLVCEIRPVKCSIDTSAGRLKTTKWMNFQHWKELRYLLKNIADDYETARNNLKVTEDIKHGKPQSKTSDSIKIAYMWALNKECCRHFLTPRKDTCWSDSEDDPITLNDKGGRYNSLQACGDMLVVSVALLNETEIQHKIKPPKKLQGLQSHRATSESAASSQRLDRSLILALDPTLVPETPNISEYFSTQKADSKSTSNSNLEASLKIQPRITTSKSRTSENTKKSQLQQPVLQVEDIENAKKKSRSCFDTDSSSSIEVPINPSSTSSDSQTEAAASKIFKKVSAVEIEFDNLNTSNYDVKDTTTEIKGLTIKKENITKKVYSPSINSINDYAQRTSKCSFSVPLVGLDKNKKSFLLENIKVERSDNPDHSRERSVAKNIQSSCSSRKTPRPFPRISSPVDEICSETPEPYLKVGNSPTRSQMDLDNSMDFHTELITTNELEIHPLDLVRNKDQTSTRKLGHDQETNYSLVEGKSINKNLNLILPDSQNKNKMTTKCSDTSHISINNYLRIEPENVQNSNESDLIGKFIKKEYLDGENYEQDEHDRKDNSPHSLKHHGHQKKKYMKSLDSYNKKSYKDREKAHIECESDIGNECTDLIPHTTEEITDRKLYDFETEESNDTSKNLSDSSKLPVSVVTACESVTKNTKILEEPGETCSSSASAVITNKNQSSPTRKRRKKNRQICKIRTRSKSNDVIGIATLSPDLFDDNYGKTVGKNLTVSKTFNTDIEIDEETKTMEEVISKEFISQKKDSGNIPGTDDRNVILSNTPEKISSTTCELSNLESSPIFRNRAIKRKNNHQNSSLQKRSKRLKPGRGKCNTQIFDDTTVEDSFVLVKDLAKDSKKIYQIQKSETSKKDDVFDIEEDIFTFSNESIQCRKTLDEIMKTNNGEDLGKSNDEEILNRDAVECGVLNNIQMASSQFNLNNDNDGDDEDNGDYDDRDDDKEDSDHSNDEDYDLPDLGSAEVCINAMEGSDVSCGPIEQVLLKRDKNIHQNIKFQSVTDIFSSPPKLCKENEYSREAHDIYIPSECPKASDLNYSPTPISLLYSNETKKSYVSNSQETNNSNMESTLDSAESPDARRSRRIQCKKGERKLCCSGCETQSSPRKMKSMLSKMESKNLPNKNNDFINTVDGIKRNIKFSSNIKGKGKNKKNSEKSDDKIKKTGIIDPPNSQEMTSEKNNGSNIVCAKERFSWGQFDSTQAILDSELPDEWECDSSEVQPNAKTKKAQAEFEKIRKNFKSRKKKQNTDITLYMESCKVSKSAKEIKPMHRKSNISRNKLKNTNPPKNQSKINFWITKDSKQANPTVNEEPKASGSKDFENALCENDSLYKKTLSKSKKNCQKGMKPTNDSKCDDFNLSSEQNHELHLYEDVKDIKENECKIDNDNITIGPLKKVIELEENTDYSPVPSIGDDSRLYTCGPSEQLDSSQSSVQITHEEIIPTRAEKASEIAQSLVVISCAELESLVTKHLPFLKRVAKGVEDNERHEIYMQGGAAARSNTPEVIFAPFTDEQLEHVHSVLRSNFLKKLQQTGIEGKEYLWMVLVPTFLIRLVMTMEGVSFEDAELLFKDMAFPKRPSRDSLGFGDPW